MGRTSDRALLFLTLSSGTTALYVRIVLAPICLPSQKAIVGLASGIATLQFIADMPQLCPSRRTWSPRSLLPRPPPVGRNFITGSALVEGATIILLSFLHMTLLPGRVTSAQTLLVARVPTTRSTTRYPSLQPKIGEIIVSWAKGKLSSADAEKTKREVRSGTWQGQLLRIQCTKPEKVHTGRLRSRRAASGKQSLGCCSACGSIISFVRGWCGCHLVRSAGPICNL